MSKKKFKPIEEVIKKEEGEKKEKRQIIVTPKTAVNGSEGQKKYIEAIQNNDIVFCSGPSGSGKTFIAVGMALQYLLVPNSQFSKIIAIRPIVEAGPGPGLGYLPGDLNMKAAPFMAPILIDSLEAFISKPQIAELFKSDRIEVLPVGFCRGRSLRDSLIIVDEAQNATPDQILLVLSRIGENSKMIINGDLDQSDIRGRNGLQDAFERLQGINRIAFVEMTSAEIVRHPLIKEILSRYQKGSK